MNFIELINHVGLENITVQPLEHDMQEIKESKKAGATLITFGTKALSTRGEREGTLRMNARTQQTSDHARRQAAMVEEWNASYPVGTPVRYYQLTDHKGWCRNSETRSRAELLGGHTAVVWLVGVSGCWGLDCVTPLSQCPTKNDQGSGARTEAASTPQPLPLGKSSVSPSPQVAGDERESLNGGNPNHADSAQRQDQPSSSRQSDEETK